MRTPRIKHAKVIIAQIGAPDIPQWQKLQAIDDLTESAMADIPKPHLIATIKFLMGIVENQAAKDCQSCAVMKHIERG